MDGCKGNHGPTGSSPQTLNETVFSLSQLIIWAFQLLIALPTHAKAPRRTSQATGTGPRWEAARESWFSIPGPLKGPSRCGGPSHDPEFPSRRSSQWAPCAYGARSAWLCGKGRRGGARVRQGWERWLGQVGDKQSTKIIWNNAAWTSLGASVGSTVLNLRSEVDLSLETRNDLVEAQLFAKVL